MRLTRRVQSAAPSGLRLTWCVDGRSEWQFASAHPPRLEVRSVDGVRGLGGFAAGSGFAAGARILAEAPLLERRLNEVDSEVRMRRAVAGMEQAAAVLTGSARSDFYDLSMHSLHGAEPHAYGIWLSNAYPTDEEPEPEGMGGVFRTVCRLNHSCRPNAHVAWNPRIRLMTVHALVDIDEGAEVLVAYAFTGEGDVRAARQATLRSDFGFACACELCSLTGVALAESDARQARIRQLGHLIVSHGGETEEEAAEAEEAAAAGRTDAGGAWGDDDLVALVEERLWLLRLEGLFTNWDSASVAMAHLQSTGDAAGAARWAVYAADFARRALGEDSDEYIRYARVAGLERWAPT